MVITDLVLHVMTAPNHYYSGFRLLIRLARPKGASLRCVVLDLWLGWINGFTSAQLFTLSSVYIGVWQEPITLILDEAKVAEKSVNR
jgi:hypothetical protein